MTFRRTLFILAALGAMVVPSSVLAISAQVSGKGENDLDVDAAEDSQFNLADCRSNVGVTFEVTVTEGENTSWSIYVFTGSSCFSDPTGCEMIEGPLAGSLNSFSLNVQDLFGVECIGTVDVNLWVALLETETQTEDEGGFWPYDPLILSADMDVPLAVPTGVSAKVQSDGAKISWEDLDDSDVGGFLVVYWDGTAMGTDSDTDTDTDTDTDVDTDTDTDTDTDADTDTDTDTDVDAGADGGASFWPEGDHLPYANGDGGADDQGPCPDGGFEQGQTVDPGSVTGIEDSAKTDSSATSVSVSGLTENPHKFAVVAVDDFANPGPISEIVCVTPEETVDFDEVYEGAGGSGGDKFCFVATAVYGDPDHPVVASLRQFRDRFLLEAPGGEAAVGAYYAVGPSMAAALEDAPVVRSALERLLFLLAGLGMLLISIGPGWLLAGLGVSLTAGLITGIAVPRTRRKR